MSKKVFVVPPKWKETHLKHIAQIKSGSTPLRAQNERYFTNGTIPWIKTMDLTNSKITETDELITETAIQETSCPILEPDTVLVAMYGGFNQIGRTGIMTFSGSINQAISSLSINKEKAIPNYVLYWLNANVILWRRFAASSRKDPNITKKDVEDFPILLPPLPEQRKIADILSTWDEAIAKTEQLLAALRQRKKALMQRLLTGQVRFPGFDGDWKEVKFGEVFAERVERGFDNLPLLSVTENGIVYRDDLERRDNSNEDKSKYLRICPGDIGYNTMRMWQGRSALSKYEGIVSPAYTVLIPKKNIDVRFMAYLFKFQPMIHTFYRYSQGLVSDTWSLKYDVFAKIHITIPDVEEQKRIAEVLELCDKEISQAQTYFEKLQQQKKGLMQRLLTGQVRVKV